MVTNNVSNYLASDDKPNNDLYEITSSHVKAHAILSDHSFDSNSVIENSNLLLNQDFSFLYVVCSQCLWFGQPCYQMCSSWSKDLFMGIDPEVRYFIFQLCTMK